MNKVRALESTYLFCSKILSGIIPILGTKRPFIWFMVTSEKAFKKPLFGCQMCGQCILHSTGMVCPMGCPKTLRNGPCGGVRSDGNCEIKPDMKCVWIRAWDNSTQMAVFTESIQEIQPQLDHSLSGTSAWINELGKKNDE